MKKRMIILTLALSVSLFAGCAQQQAAEPVTDQEAVTETQIPVEALEDATPEAEDVVDLAEEEQVFDNLAPEDEAQKVSENDVASGDMAMDEEFIPSDFLQEKLGRSEFESFDEVISLLPAGSGYAYINLEGYDGELLVISESTYDDLEGHMAAIDAAVYGLRDGKIQNFGNAFSSGTAYPIRCEDGILYTGGNHDYSSFFVNGEGGLMEKDTISQVYDENGHATYYGFTRESNDYSTTKDIPEDSEKLFNDLIDEEMEKEIVNFTVVK